MLFTNAELEAIAENLKKSLEFTCGSQANYVAIGVGANKLCIYIQDDYLDKHSLKFISEKIKCFLTSKEVSYKINKVGKCVLAKRGQSS